MDSISPNIFVRDINDTIEFYNARAVIADAIVKNQSCSNKSDGSIELIGEGLFDPFSYSIGARSYQDIPVFDNLFAGEYTVKIIDQRECVQTKKFIVGLNTTILTDYDVENESIFWKIKIPETQALGSYAGENTFSATADTTCTDAYDPTP